MSRSQRLAAAFIASTMAIGLVSAAESATAAVIRETPVTTVSTNGYATTTVNALAVKGRAPQTGYSRSMFGAAWADVNRNGCDTRNDMLRRDMTRDVFRSGTRNCVMLSGTLADKYLGRTYTWRRGTTTSSLVQIDHVVALSDAWQKGAQRWSSARRAAFANDPLNLLAVNGKLNTQKGASDAASWLPPNKSYRCDYVARQASVKRKYGLWVTAAEKSAMLRVLGSCAGKRIPTGGLVLGVVAPVGSVTGAPGSGAGSGSSTGTNTGADDPRFGSCAEAKANRYGPYRRGIDPEYAWYRDGDGDGIVCE